jgi:hypothetical protein
MLKPYRIVAAFVVLLVIAPFALSLEPSKPKVESGQLGTNQSAEQPAPTMNFPSLQEITEAIANGIESAEKQRDANHPAPPPDSAGGYLNLLLAIFTGLLVIVGGANCFLIFWTLKATQTAADAAKKSADVAERALVELEGPFLYPVAITNDIRDSFRRFILNDNPATPHNPAEPIIKFAVKNYGRTPALPQSVIANLFSGMPDDTSFTEKAEQMGFTNEVLLASDTTSGTVFECKIIKGIDKAEYDKITGGVARIFLRGTIVFYDIFGNEYMQPFCWAWDPKTDRFAAWGLPRNKRIRNPSVVLRHLK